MARSWIAFGLVAALLSAGCVPVTEPVGDIEKAEPDKGLVGTWVEPKPKGPAAPLANFEELTFDAPAVKGNPKGLMRTVTGNAGADIWFFTATVGKHTYANLILAPGAKSDLPQFDKEGAFAKWKEAEAKRFYVFRYTRDGDTLTIDYGNSDAFTKLMRAADIRDDGTKHFPFFLTPADWFEKGLGKDGAEKVFDGTDTVVLKRKKK